MLFPDLVGEDDRCDAVSHNQDEHGDALQNRAGNHQTGDDNQDSGQGKTDASCPLTEVPAGVVCHAPLGAKSEHPVSLDLWQDVPNRDERQPQHNSEDFGDGLSRFGSHFKLGTGGEEHRHKKPEKMTPQDTQALNAAREALQAQTKDLVARWERRGKVRS